MLFIDYPPKNSRHVVSRLGGPASHADEKQFHDDAVAKLQREHHRLQDRIDAMYIDKLDGRIGNDFFDTKAAEILKEQTAIMREIEAHQTANRNYIEEGVQLLELAQRAHVLFESQPAGEKRRLLNFVLSNSTWKDGELTATYRQPFDMLAVAVASEKQVVAAGMAETARRDIWLPSLNGALTFSRPVCYGWCAIRAMPLHEMRTNRYDGGAGAIRCDARFRMPNPMRRLRRLAPGLPN